jgi:hypothetical protein
VAVGDGGNGDVFDLEGLIGGLEDGGFHSEWLLACSWGGERVDAHR